MFPGAAGLLALMNNLLVRGLVFISFHEGF